MGYTSRSNGERRVRPAEPVFTECMRRGLDDMENGRYSMNVLNQRDRIPKLKVVRKSEAARRWAELEKRIPGLKGRLIQAQRDLAEGKGYVLRGADLIPLSEYKAGEDTTEAPKDK